MSAETQQVLDRAYTLVAAELKEFFRNLIKRADEELSTLERLAQKLAQELGIPRPKPDDLRRLFDDEETLVEDMTWLPVAEECVVTLMRALLERAVREGSNFSPSWLKRAQLEQGEVIDLDEFARSVGLKKDDAGLALNFTRHVFLDSDLFAQPVTLEMDGMKFSIVRQDNRELLVRRINDGSHSSGHKTGSPSTMGSA